MDGFAGSMLARGPTFTADRQTVTGSLHVLGLPSVDAAHEFVAHEPNNRAGVYGEHAIWRFENLLGRTMWEFPGPADEPKYLVIALEPPGEILPPEQLILYGALATLDEAAPAGVALAVAAPDLEQALAGLPKAEVHAWEFGGRR